ISSMPISSRCSPSDGVAESSAPNPLPNPRLFMVEHLPCEIEVGDRSTRLQVVEHHGLAVAWRFRQPNAARDDRFEDLAREIAVDLVADLESEARTSIKHRQDDPEDIKASVESFPNELDRLGEMSKALERVELAL